MREENNRNSRSIVGHSKLKLESPKRKPRDPMEARTKAKSHTLGKGAEIKPITIGESKRKPNAKGWKVSDFKSAEYNPRYISDGRLRKLKKSMETFGDLSGVVFNVRTQRLVSGHQRLKTVGDAKTKIETKPYTDKHGTIEVGHVIAHTPNGIIKIPLRIVDWTEEKVEKAANIAANSHGGEFDKEKLRKVLTSLETHTFDIELLGLDPLTISSLTIPQTETPSGGATSGRTPRPSTDGEFKEYTEDSFELSHTCPRCNFKFDSKNKEVKPKKDASPKRAKTSSKPQAKKSVKKIGITKKKTRRA